MSSGFPMDFQNDVQRICMAFPQDLVRYMNVKKAWNTFLLFINLFHFLHRHSSTAQHVYQFVSVKRSAGYFFSVKDGFGHFVGKQVRNVMDFPDIGM